MSQIILCLPGTTPFKIQVLLEDNDDVENSGPTIPALHGLVSFTSNVMCIEHQVTFVSINDITSLEEFNYDLVNWE
jgi:hypothetical protein